MTIDAEDEKLRGESVCRGLEEQYDDNSDDGSSDFRVYIN